MGRHSNAQLRFRALGKALQAVFYLFLLSAAPAVAQTRIEISGPEGEAVPGGRVVPYGSVFEVTIILDDGPGGYNSWVPGGAGDIVPDDNRIAGTLDTTYAYGVWNGYSGKPYVPFHYAVSRYIDGTETFLAAKTIWVLNPIPEFGNVLEILNGPSFTQGDRVNYQVRFPDDIFKVGQPERNPAEFRDFGVALAHLGGTLGDGTPIEESSSKITRNRLKDRGDYTTSRLDPGIYELRLIRVTGGEVYARSRFEVLPDTAPPRRGTREDPVLLETSFTRRVSLPKGATYRLGEPIPIEVEWVKDDPEVADLPEWRQQQDAVLVTPPPMALACVKNADDILRLRKDDVVMSRQNPNLYAGEIESPGVGLHQLVIFGEINWDEVQTFNPPIVEMIPITVLAPDGSGILSMTVTGETVFEQTIEVTLTRSKPRRPGEAPPPSLRPMVKLVRLPSRTAGGTFTPEATLSQKILEESRTAHFRVPVGVGSYEIRAIANYPCAQADCRNVILDRISLPESDVFRDTINGEHVFAPEEVKSRVWLDPEALAVVQTWPSDTVPLEMCEQVAVPPREADYQPPPWLAFGAASYPRDPDPGLPLTAVFRIENKSDLPAADITVDLTLVDPKYDRPPQDLEYFGEFCQQLDIHRFSCTIGDMDPGKTADLEFVAQTPMSGVIFWHSTLESTGDLGGLVDYRGVFGNPAPPRITEVVVMADQTRVEDEVPLYPYPFGPNSRGRQSRYLLVVGHNMPGRSDQQWPLPDQETINYAFLAYPDTENPIYLEWFARGWMQFFGVADPAGIFARAETDGYEALLIRADLLEGVMPGQQSITVSTASRKWALEFGDVSARLAFIRELPGNDLDLLTNAYYPERIRLAVETNMPLPVEEIPVFLNAQGLGAGKEDEIALMATRTTLGDGRVYATRPLDLHEASKTAVLPGGLTLAVKPVRSDSKQPQRLLKGRIGENFIFEEFRLSIDPLAAEVRTGRASGQGKYSWPWRDALDRAAACHDDIQIDNWNRLTTAESEEIWNLMVFLGSELWPSQ